MEAPDKIYINDDEWHYYPVGEKCEEYIHKNTLIEWVNEMLQNTADRLDFHGNKAFSQLLDKLNSL